MYTHQTIFGDKMDRAIQYIVVEAHRVKTASAYEEAYQKLSGIKTLVIFMASENGIQMPTLLLSLQNLLVLLRQAKEETL